MSAWYKVAWFNLAVVTITAILVGVLIPILGPTRAQGGFGVLGLLGLAPFFHRKGSAVLEDERDQMIRCRSTVITFSIFWMAFVAACMSLPARYGWDGSVPVSVVLSGIWYGVMLVVGVMAVTSLIMYRMGRADGA